ncbi:MAG: TatD family hydrolase [Methanocellales archaeon]|nr:TatD family hydrolase [Methanocellales archaeon]
MIEYYDCHCHVNMLERSILEECRNLNINIVAVSTDINSYEKTSELMEMGLIMGKQFIGYHPDSIMPENLSNLKKVMDFINANTVEGIGEIGLDLSPRFMKHTELQTRVFKKFLETAETKNLPVNIHSRKAQPQVLEVLKNYRIKTFLHWFCGSKKQLKEAIDLGYYIGFTPACLKSNRYNKLIKATPIEFILTESDAPVYEMSPQDMPLLIDRIASLKEIPPREVADGIKTNYLKWIGEI